MRSVSPTGDMAMTMMACADTMGTEYEFTQALGTVDGYRITGDTLALLTGGTVVLRFEAIYLQ